jgi:hypothetical protein
MATNRIGTGVATSEELANATRPMKHVDSDMCETVKRNLDEAAKKDKARGSR